MNLTFEVDVGSTAVFLDEARDGEREWEREEEREGDLEDDL